MSNMKFKTYTKYKDSKIEWIEEIPADWKINKVKYLVDKSVYYPIGDGDHGQITPDMYQDKGVPYIRVQNLSWNGEILFKGMVYISEEINLVNKKSILKPQDLLIAKTGATIGKIGFMPKNINLANTTSSVGKITINKKIHSPFFWNYYFQSDIFQNQIFISAYQKSAQPGFNIEDLVDFIVIIPSLKEQFIIANFLDKKIAKIDELIEKDKKLIELLKEKHTALINHAVTKGLDPNIKMKDSGPKGWEMRKLKFVSKLFGRIGFRGYAVVDLVKEGKGALTIGGKHISNDNKLDLTNPEYLSWKKYYESPEIMVNKGDVIITQRGTLGKSILIEEDIGPTTINPSMILIKKIMLVSKYLYYFLISDFSKKEVELITSKTAVPMISQEQANNLTIIFPKSKKEQIQIIQYLDKATLKIDKTIQKIKQKINFLEEYKKSLIHHTVTGKIDIRGLEY